MGIAELREAALKLPPDERAELADELWASLGPADQAQIDAEQAAEADRIARAIDAGGEELIPAEDVHREIEARLEARKR